MNNLDELIRNLLSELRDIYDKINDNVPLSALLEIYDSYNKKMLVFIKSRDLQHFILWFNMIKPKIENENYTRMALETELQQKDVNNCEYLTSYFLKYIYNNIIISDIPEEKQECQYKIKIEEYNNQDNQDNFALNDSQKQVKEYYNKYGVENGIICHATGTGKTICEFITMGHTPNHKIIFLLCNYIDIINQTFYDRNNKFNYALFSNLRNIGIFNVWDYDIYNLSTGKRDAIMRNIDDIIQNPRNKIFLINTQYIAHTTERYKRLPTPDLILFDECHCITANNTYKILTHFKNPNTQMVGLSATPIRYLNSDVNYDKLRNIFSKTGENINIISNYENVKAIIKGDILNIEIFWFEAKITTNAKNDEDNIMNCIKQISNVMQLMHYKKLLLWGGTIEFAVKLHKRLLSKLPLLYNSHKIIKYEDNMKITENDIPVFLDHSDIKEKNGSELYCKFRPLKHCIIVCAEKYREGSDIPYLGCIALGDLAKNKSPLVFIQCIGRAQRKEKDAPEKQIAYVIDHIDVADTQQQRVKSTVNKLIGYYNDFYTKSLHAESNKDLLQKYKIMISRYDFKKLADSNIILVSLNDEFKIKIHACEINIKMQEIEREFTREISRQFKEEHNLQDEDLLQLEYDAFRTKNKEDYNIGTDIEYNTKVETLNLVPNPRIKYSSIWKNWYDYLGIDTSAYPQTVEEWRYYCKIYGITFENDYEIKAHLYNLPLMPQELYIQLTKSKSPIAKYRDMSKCFTNGQRIRHTVGINKTWIGIYDSTKNGIVYDNKIYKSLSGFAAMHYSIDRKDRVSSANGWKECECEINGKWISTYNL